MKKYTRLYYDFFDYPKDPTFHVPCEICLKPAVDIHHIDCKGMGGSKEKDFIENLMGTCRDCHVEHGDNPIFRDALVALHFQFITLHRPDYAIQIHKMGVKPVVISHLAKK